MTRTKRIILNDLSKHLHDKVCQNVEDFMDNCRTAGLSYPDVASDLMVFFSHLASGYAAFQFNIDEDQFIHIMRIQFKEAQKKERKA